MAEQRPAVAPPHGLRLLRGDTLPGTDTAAGVTPGAATDPTPVSASVAGAEVVPVSGARRAGAALQHRARGIAGELWLNPGRVLHVMWTSKPESLAEHFTYVKSAAWVPEELAGKKATVITLAGFAYHILIAWPLLLFAKALGGAAPRPLRLLALAVPFVILYLVL